MKLDWDRPGVVRATLKVEELAALVAGETLSAGELIGLVVVFAGIAMTSGAFKLPRLAWTTSTSES